MNEFVQTMYLELGIWMVVLGAWVDPEGKKKWSMYEICHIIVTGHWWSSRFESNSSLGNEKPNFTTNEPQWHEKLIEKIFHAYIEDYLTGDEEGKTVTCPSSTAKPKPILRTSDKG